jgi:hypothetical protein
MIRNCVASVVLWIALVIGYGVFLRGRIESPTVAGAAAGTIVGFGLLMLHGSMYAFRDFGAHNRMARGEHPHDGDLVAAIGTIHPSGAGAPLQSPLNDVPCVLYSYEIGPARSHESSAAVARSVVGFGLMRCSIRTPYGEFELGSWPALEGFAKRHGDRTRAGEYVRATEFRTFGFAAFAKAMMHLYVSAPPLKEDWRMSDADIDTDSADVFEQTIAPGAPVTALGRYSAAANAIVSDTKKEGFLRLKPGGQAHEPEAVPWEGIGKAFGGLVSIAAPNVALYLYFTRVLTR